MPIAWVSGVLAVHVTTAWAARLTALSAGRGLASSALAGAR